MRRLFLAGSFLVLVAALVLLWSHRFERVPGLPVWSLTNLREGVPEVPGVEWAGAADDPVLRLRVDGETPRVALRLAIPGAPAVGMLMLRYRMSASGLTPGKDKWQSGRMMIEWHPPYAAGEIEEDPVGGIKLDEKHDDLTLVTVPEHAPARPALRLEHLGLAGGFELADLEITAVQDRELWKTGRWFLASGWLIWLVVCIRTWPGIGRWSAIAAAIIWLLMGIYFVVPGPWKTQRPFGIGFRLGKMAGLPQASQIPSFVAFQSPSGPTSGAVSPSGRIPVRGGLPLRIKGLFVQARPLLHILLLMAPTLASAWLVGNRPTLILAVLLSLAIEAAQVAFGYGFDWIDVLDLLTDSVGIALGLWACRRFQQRWFVTPRFANSR